MNELKEWFDKKGVMVAAHRGLCGANIPCNTIPAFEIAVANGASIVELDLFKTADGQIMVFHTGKESHQFKVQADVTKMTEAEVRQLRYLNADRNETHYGVELFDDVLEHFKGRCLLNLDRCDGFLADAVRCVERHGMRDQILLKTAPKPHLLAEVEACAPNYMYMPIYKEQDTATEQIGRMNIHMVGAELVFATEESPVAQQEYIDRMRAKGLVLWGNTLIYNEKVPLTAGHNDDVSVLGRPEDGWGWLAKKGFGIIQTDWTAQCAVWLKENGYSF